MQRGCPLLPFRTFSKEETSTKALTLDPKMNIILMKKHLLDHTTSGPSTAAFIQVSLSKKQPSCFLFLCHKLPFFDQHFKGFLLRKVLLNYFPQCLTTIFRIQYTFLITVYMTFISIQSYKFLRSKKTVCPLKFTQMHAMSQILVDWFNNHDFFYNQSISRAFNGNFLLGARRNTENI